METRAQLHAPEHLAKSIQTHPRAHQLSRSTTAHLFPLRPFRKPWLLDQRLYLRPERFQKLLNDPIQWHRNRGFHSSVVVRFAEQTNRIAPAYEPLLFEFELENDFLVIFGGVFYVEDQVNP